MISDHVFRQLTQSIARRRLPDECAYMSCGRTAAEHERRISTRWNRKGAPDAEV